MNCVAIRQASGSSSSAKNSGSSTGVPVAAPGAFTAGIRPSSTPGTSSCPLSLNSNPKFRTLPVAIVPIAIFPQRAVDGLTQGGLEG